MKKFLLFLLTLAAGFALGWTIADGAYQNPGWWMRILVLTLLMIFAFVQRNRIAKRELINEYKEVN